MDATHPWHSLPDDVKSRILDEHRYRNTEHHNWWDYVYSDFTEDMAKVGICVEQMYFSGFWDQGDGACFEGYIEDWELFLKSVGYSDPLLIAHFKENARYKVEHFGRYYHENCTSFTAELPLPTDAYETEENFLRNYGTRDEVRDAVLIAALSQYSGDDLDALFEETFKDHMRDLYRSLEEEYDHLTSDEAVLESLEANDQLDDLIAEYTEELECEDE